MGRQGTPARGDAARLRRSGRQGKVRYLGCSTIRHGACPGPVGETTGTATRATNAAAQVQPGDPRRVRARASSPSARAGRGRIPYSSLRGVPVASTARVSDAQDGARRGSREDVHERSGVPRLARVEKVAAAAMPRRRCRSRGSRTGRVSTRRSERHDGGAAQGAGGGIGAQAGRGRRRRRWIRPVRGGES